MPRPIFSHLAPVRTRQRWMFALKASGWGLAIGSLAAVALQLLSALSGSLIPSMLKWGLLAAGPLVGAFVGLLWRRSWEGAAMAVDRHYRLKDRALTALAFVSRPGQTPWSELQLADAVQHLSNVEPRQVVPFRLPRVVPFAVGGFVIALVVLGWTSPSPVVEAGPAEPLAAIVEEAESIEQDLEKFAELARNEQNKELEELVEELREKVQAMKQPGVDVKEALAKLSEMQTAMQAQASKYNVAAIDAELQSLGTALQAADATQNAGKAMAEGKHDKAAAELEKNDSPQLDRKEARSLEEQLKKLAEQMAELGMGSLSDATSKVCEGCKGNGEKMKEGMRGLAKECRGQGQRKKITDMLRSQCDKLSECKGNCQKNSFAKGKKPEKSTNPSSSFGMATSGNAQGDKTDPLGQNKFEQLTGQEGDGDSEVETTRSIEGQQQAGRDYREVYQKYRKLSESVLDSEAIPLGHRQTIRRYFELIRPQQGDLPENAPESK